MSDSASRALGLVVDSERCMGTGTCMVYAPASITFDDHGKAAVAEPVNDDLDALRAAVESCPTEALSLLDSEH
jgi:ferredoxin